MTIMFTLKNKVKAGLILTLLIAFLASCSKKDDPVPIKPPTTPTTPTTKSSEKEILRVDILKSENANISGDGYFYKSGSKFYITIPLNSTLTAVKVNFAISSKASIKIDGTTLANNTGMLDLSKTLSAVVTAEDASTTTYTIMAQIGIKEIDEMLYPFIEKYAIPAASYAISKNGIEDLVYKNAIGFANVEANQRADADYEFRLASMSKQHTAIAIMSLIQNGKIGIDDLVFGATGILKAYWPSVGPKSSKVTVRHLLEHTGGYWGDPMFSSASGATLDEKIQYMLNSAQNEPGTIYTYYNMGYGTLGKVIEVVSGKEYGAYLKEIYAPAGVVVNLASSSPASSRTKEAICYPQGSSTTAYGNNIEVYKAAGGVSINTENLFKVLYSVDGGSIKPDILNSTYRNLMFTKSAVSNYAMGWRTSHNLFDGYYHGGNLIGSATFWIYGTEYSAAILLNSRSSDSGFDTELILLTNKLITKAKELGL